MTPAAPPEQQQTLRIAVLGGGGFLGSHLIAALLARTAHRLIAVDVDLDRLDQLGRAEGRLRRVEASISEPGIVEAAVDQSDLVISLTALCNPSLYNTRPLEVIDASYTDLVPLVRRCAALRRRLVHCSTCEVYGATAPDTLLSEDQTPLVLGPVHRERWTYACAKQLLERTIWALGQHGELPFTIVRPFNVIGPRMDYLAGVDGDGIPRVLACFIGALLAGEPLALVDGGHRRRSFICVDDFVGGMLRVIARPEACRGTILNLGNAENDVSIAELADRLAAVFVERHGGIDPGRQVVSGEAFYGPGYDDAEQRIPDIARARRLLDWQPTTTLAQMLPPIIDDYVARYAGRIPARSAGRAQG